MKQKRLKKCAEFSLCIIPERTNVSYERLGESLQLSFGAKIQSYCKLTKCWPIEKVGTTQTYEKHKFLLEEKKKRKIWTIVDLIIKLIALRD